LATNDNILYSMQHILIWPECAK